MERVVGYATVGLGCILASATFLFGDSIVYERTNSFAIISASTFFLIRFMADSSGESKNPEAADFAVIRWGLLNFVAFRGLAKLAGQAVGIKEVHDDIWLVSFMD